MKKLKQKSIKSLMVMSILPFFAACEVQVSDVEVTKVSSFNSSKACQEQAGDFICNGLNGATFYSSNPRTGLIAKLYEGKADFSNLERFFVEGEIYEDNVFFSNFNVSTNLEEGFGNKNFVLLNDLDQPLNSNFAISAEGNIVLPDDEEEGAYHITTISDDGIRVAVDQEVILENDTPHAPTVDCANQLVFLNHGEEKQFKLDYFQSGGGITVKTLIKRIDPENFDSSSCNMGDEASLLANGYKIMKPQFFTIPSGFVRTISK